MPPPHEQGQSLGFDLFAAERPRLLGIAYRMLSTLTDAEDVVQDVWLRWQGVEHDTIERHEAWLTTVTVRVALDYLRSERRQRERLEYIGPWLPEPIVADPGPEAAAEMADSLTLGFLTLFDRLSPVERAVFLLVEVFRVPFAEVSITVGRSEMACRQIASRARRRLQDAPTRRPRDNERRVVDRLAEALVNGDDQTAVQLVAPDVVLMSDGGAARRAARRPVVGSSRVVRFMTNLVQRQLHSVEVEAVSVNGDPGFVVRSGRTVDNVIAFEIQDQQVVTIWIIRNPSKLDHVGELIQLS